MSAPATTARVTSLGRAAVRATLAPSVHNPPSWRLPLENNRLGVYADRARQLAVLDPSSRQLLISCGCAVMNACVSLAGSGVGLVCGATRTRCTTIC